MDCSHWARGMPGQPHRAARGPYGVPCCQCHCNLPIPWARAKAGAMAGKRAKSGGAVRPRRARTVVRRVWPQA
eukprot:scaffold257767_cov30-Tisochrysis_lutea.AAC.1